MRQFGIQGHAVNAAREQVRPQLPQPRAATLLQESHRPNGLDRSCFRASSIGLNAKHRGHVLTQSSYTHFDGDPHAATMIASIRAIGVAASPSFAALQGEMYEHQGRSDPTISFRPSCVCGYAVHAVPGRRPESYRNLLSESKNGCREEFVHQSGSGSHCTVQRHL
jgi:hypothetical protein